jgi:hypothetical protein
MDIPLSNENDPLYYLKIKLISARKEGHIMGIKTVKNSK